MTVAQLRRSMTVREFKQQMAYDAVTAREARKAQEKK